MKTLTVYTAGPMDHNTSRPHALWRRQLEAQIPQEIRRLGLGLSVKFVHPEDQCGDHNGPNAYDVVRQNHAAIKKCDVVIAYLLHPDQHGTVVELFWAHEERIPVILVADASLFLDFGLNQTQYWYVEEYLKLDPIEINILDFTPVVKPLFETMTKVKVK